MDIKISNHFNMPHLHYANPYEVILHGIIIVIAIAGAGGIVYFIEYIKKN
jgi:hypothetical protein